MVVSIFHFYWKIILAVRSHQFHKKLYLDYKHLQSSDGISQKPLNSSLWHDINQKKNLIWVWLYTITFCINDLPCFQSHTILYMSCILYVSLYSKRLYRLKLYFIIYINKILYCLVCDVMCASNSENTKTMSTLQNQFNNSLFILIFQIN